MSAASSDLNMENRSFCNRQDECEAQQTDLSLFDSDYEFAPDVIRRGDATNRPRFGRYVNPSDHLDSGLDPPGRHSARDDFEREH
jgi:hypothetical protein